jgi:hypothetical protein
MKNKNKESLKTPSAKKKKKKTQRQVPNLFELE